MKRSLILLPLLLAWQLPQTFAGVGDTTIVQTFTFGSDQNAWFEFPPADKRWEKIMMEYTLKCIDGGAGGLQFDCGEWDYLTYSYLYEHTGNLDSNLLWHHNFEVDGQPKDTFYYLNNPSWQYWLDWDYAISHTDTTSLNVATIAPGGTTTNQPFTTSMPQSRVQYIWKSAELVANGLQNGNITGMRLDVQSLGDALQNLTIRMKSTTDTAFTGTAFDEGGFTMVYQQTTSFQNTGWQSLQFLTPFNWDSTTHLLVDISFDNNTPGTDHTVNASDRGYDVGILANGNFPVLDFEGADLIQVPAGPVAVLDSFVTVMFWQYGDPDVQPQNDFAFEALDAGGNRVLNVHLPWSNSRVYWDAGNDGGSYDRVDANADPDEFEGQWNHWAFTKNALTGSMKIILNGAVWISVGGRQRDMTGITTFKIGSNGNGGGNYDGMLSDFAVFDAELDPATIAAYMNTGINAQHPFYNKLLLYYKLNEGTGAIATDLSPSGNNGTLFGMPAWTHVAGWDLFMSPTTTTIRPDAVFEQGVFTSVIDTSFTLDSVQMAPLSVVLFEDTNKPNISTDTILLWPQYSRPQYDMNGNLVSETLVPYDNVLYREDHSYYGDPFEVINRWEIGRFITPYGINLTLGEDGFTWVRDVTDYATLLHDSVHLAAGNWQEHLDVRFVMIEGIPERDVVQIDKIWGGSYGLAGFTDNVAAQTLPIHHDAKGWRVKTRTTGHGFGNDAVNCAEFCDKNHFIMVDGIRHFQWHVWDECSWNPLYPQGGTWVYDRGGWCPGKPVTTYDHELTVLIPQNADSVTLDYDYETWDQYGNYVFEAQLIQYTAPNHELDASIEAILSPNKAEVFGRWNPVCDNPEIKVKNKGDKSIHSMTIAYGVEGGVTWYYDWTGNLAFLDTTTIVLPPFGWNGLSDTNPRFEAEIICVNGYRDEYRHNDLMNVPFELPPVYDSVFVCQLNTNNRGVDNSYYLMNEMGDTLYKRPIMGNNQTYFDTFRLDPGCYEFRLYDAGKNGMSWWAASSEGNGSASFKNNGPGYITFFESKWHENPGNSVGDFGGGLIHHFMVGGPLGKGQTKTPPPTPDACEQYVGLKEQVIQRPVAPQVNVYPNPMTTRAQFEVLHAETYDFVLYDLVGHVVRRMNNITFRNFELRRGSLPSGMYLYEFRTYDTLIGNGKLVIE